MKSRIFIAAVCVVLLSSAFILFKSQKLPVSHAEKRALAKFINKLSESVNDGDAGINVYFDNVGTDNDTDSLLHRLRMTGYDNKGFNLTFNAATTQFKKVDNNRFEATVQIVMYRQLDKPLNSKVPVVLNITRVFGDSMRVHSVNAKEFNKAYVSYSAFIYNKFLSDTARYQPATINAFKLAEALNQRGDSVMFFQHYANQTWFYTKQGKGVPIYELDNYNQPWYLEKGKPLPETIKFGLVLNQKVIIPARYDLLHNIGATFPNLIEAENNHKRGLFNLEGKAVLPVEYDEILPLTGADTLAVVRKGPEYFWFKKDFSVIKDAGIRISEVLPLIKGYRQSFDLNKQPAGLMETPDRESYTGLYFPPSYLVDWHLRSAQEYYEAPGRKNNAPFYSISGKHKIDYSAETTHGNWFSALFYSITQGYIEGRAGLYTRKTTVIADNKHNRAYGAEIPMGRSHINNNHMAGKCAIYGITPINDTLFEARFGQLVNVELPSKRLLSAITSYNYLALKNGKLTWQESGRYFRFTEFVKMDDGYLNGCYLMGKKGKAVAATDKELLNFMKYEILADNGQPVPENWKEKLWHVQHTYNEANPKQDLSAIDRFNLAFIENKLAETKTQTLAVK